MIHHQARYYATEKDRAICEGARLPARKRQTSPFKQETKPLAVLRQSSVQAMSERFLWYFLTSKVPVSQS